MRTTLIALTALTLSLCLAPASQACLRPIGPIQAEVVEVGQNPGGLEVVEVRVTGFELPQGYGLGCTVGLGMESQILPSPTWAVQYRGLTTRLSVYDPVAETLHNDFFFNQVLTWDFNAETMGLRYFDWPMPVWFMPFTTTSHQALGGSLPVGPVTLIFEVIIKPWSSVSDFTDDLIINGYVASDYSWTDFVGGMTWLLWSNSPMVTKIDSVQ